MFFFILFSFIVFVWAEDTNEKKTKTNSDLVDSIESIEVSSRQLVILTSKRGPFDNAKLEIWTVDIETGEKISAVNMTGIILVLSRGRYTVSFLKPNHWYGVLFRFEQTNAWNNAAYVNEEEHLIKTRLESDSSSPLTLATTTDRPLVSVATKRESEGGKSLENLVIVARWEQPLSERGGLDVVINVTLFCHDQIKYKQLRLFGKELDKAVEVRLENHFDVHEERNGSARIMLAKIHPINCPRICWDAVLIAEVSDGHQFRRPAVHDCQNILPVNVSTVLRNYAGYSMVGDRLFVHTNFTNAKHQEGSQDSEKNAYVQLTAIMIPENHKPKDNASIVRFKMFNTEDHGRDFVLENLEYGCLYAVQYIYGKQSPFVYEESHRFVVDTSFGKWKNLLVPMHLRADVVNPATDEALVNLKGKPFINATDASNRSDTLISTNSEDNNLLTPTERSQKQQFRILFQLDPAFKQYKVGVDLETFCGSDFGQNSHFWLTANNPVKELDNSRVYEELCKKLPRHPVCILSLNKTQMNTNETVSQGEIGFNASSHNSNVVTKPNKPNEMSKIAENASTSLNFAKNCPPNNTNLCYTVSILVHQKIFSMPRQCLDVFEEQIMNFKKSSLLSTAAASSHAAKQNGAHRKFHNETFSCSILLKAIILTIMMLSPKSM